MNCFTGLLAQLEKLHSSLLQCRSTLVGYAEGQRAKCHWFHFIPLDDVLQFVCCGECNIRTLTASVLHTVLLDTNLNCKVSALLVHYLLIW